MSLNPLAAFLKTHLYLIRGRLHFPRNRVGEVITLPDGRKLTIFRQVIVDPAPGQPQTPGGAFHVQFHLKKMSPAVNKLFSLLPIPFFVGLPGFRSKLWLVDEATGDFHGMYCWDAVQDAQNYAHSFAMQFMMWRSVPGSVHAEVTTAEE